MTENRSNVTYTITLSEDQARVVQWALEEYFRLRMGQDTDFCNDLARMETDLSQENPEHKRLFDLYIARRDHMQELMRAFFRIAFEPYGHLKEKSEDMKTAETIWDSLRYARGKSRWKEWRGKPLQIGREPCPKIERRDG